MARLQTGRPDGRPIDPALQVAARVALKGEDRLGPGRFSSRLDELKRRTQRTLHFAKRNEAFRRHAVNHWNRYEPRIRHFAGLFVFKGLASFLFRRDSRVVYFQ